MRIRSTLMPLAVAIVIASCSQASPSPSAEAAPTATPKLVSGEATASVGVSRPAENGPIAFIRYVGGRPSIWLIEPDGGNERLLADDLLPGIQPVWTCGGDDAAMAAWSPDGEWLAFGVGQGMVCDAHIGLIRSDGSDLRIIGDAAWFAWSPSSRELVLTRNIDLGSSIRSELHFVDLEGRETRPPIGDETLEVAAAVYSPDGTRLAFAARQFPEGMEYLTHVVDLANGRLTELLPGSPTSWSPDGTKLLIEHWEGTPPDHVNVYEVTQSGDVEDVIETGGPPAHASWSPDGSLVAYFRQLTIDARVVIVAADDKAPQAEVHDDVVPQAGSTLHWSPDGDWLVFALSRGLESSIYVCRHDGTGLRVLTDGEAPAWLPRHE